MPYIKTLPLQIIIVSARCNIKIMNGCFSVKYIDGNTSDFLFGRNTAIRRLRKNPYPIFQEKKKLFLLQK